MRTKFGLRPPYYDQPVARQRYRRKKVPFREEPSAQSRVLHRTKGDTGARLGPRQLGWTMNERKPAGQQNPMEATATRSKKANAKPAKLGRDVQARLGQQLRAMYDEVVNQGVPDRFSDLINRLESSGKKDSQ
jgi:hypothetical protein